jgi:hypothetical protein
MWGQEVERFVNDSEIQENFFCFKEKSETWKGRAIFNIVYSYQETIVLSRENCVGVRIDGAQYLVVTIRGSDVTIHGCIYREMLD